MYVLLDQSKHSWEHSIHKMALEILECCFLRLSTFCFQVEMILSKSIPNISTHENNNAATIISMLNPNT